MTELKETEIGKIPEDWNVTTIGELFFVKNGKTNTQDATINGKYPLFDRSTQIKFSNKYLFDSEAIIVPGEGKEFIPHYFSGKFDLHQRVYAITPKTTKLYVRFFYYWIYYYRNYLARIAVGSTVKSLRLNHLTNFPTPKPSFSEQYAIAKILSNLDSKIELNNKMNTTLEAIAQAIFKHWFVDFEFPNDEGKPYKSSGGKMVDSERGKIPEGWKIDEVGNHINFIKGKKPKKISYSKRGGYLPQILIDTLNGGAPIYANPENMILVEKSEPIMVMDGASSGRIEIGFSGILGSTLAKVILKNNSLSSFYLLFFLKTHQENINQNTTGTSIPHTDKSRINKLIIAIPNKKSLFEFEKICKNIMNRIIMNKEELRNLQNIRDSLLPKLMSGKIRVLINVVK